MHLSFQPRRLPLRPAPQQPERGRDPRHGGEGGKDLAQDACRQHRGRGGISARLQHCKRSELFFMKIGIKLGNRIFQHNVTGGQLEFLSLRRVDPFNQTPDYTRRALGTSQKGLKVQTKTA